MKKLSLFLITAFAVSAWAGCGCFCCKDRKATTTSSYKAPQVYKETYSIQARITDSEPLVIVNDKPATVAPPEPTYVEEITTEEVVSDYDACVEQCNADNVSRSLIEFCIREKCK